MDLLRYCYTANVQGLRGNWTRDRAIPDYDARRRYHVEAHYGWADVLLHASSRSKIIFADSILEVASRPTECVPEGVVGHRLLLYIGMSTTQMSHTLCTILNQLQSWLGSVFSSLFTCDNLVEKYQQGKCGGTPDEQRRIIFSLYFSYAVDITTDLASE
jgi:hypothetical protein